MELRRARMALRFAPALALLLAGSAHAQTYTVTDLGSLGSTSGAFGVALRGQAAGYAFLNPSIVHAVRYSGGAVKDLGTLGGLKSLAHAVNEFGEVAGWSNTANGERHAFLYKSGQMVDLGTLGGTISDAIDVNDSGVACGSAWTTGNHTEKAVVWKEGKISDLGALGGTGGRAYGINRWGEVVGFAGTPGDALLHAFQWHDGAMTDLKTLGGSTSVAYSINDQGKAVGWSLTRGDGFYRATLWSEGRVIDLGTFPNQNSVAYAINNLSYVVGFSYNSQDQMVAILHNTEKLYDLNTRIPLGTGWSLHVAYDINDAGQIVGVGTLNGVDHAFLLTPEEQLGVDLPQASARLDFLGAQPDPVVTATDFAFELPAAGRVKLQVFDAQGRRRATIADRAVNASVTRIAWNARGDDGARLDAGIYWARLEYGGRALTRRLVVLR